MRENVYERGFCEYTEIPAITMEKLNFEKDRCPKH